MPKDEIKSVQRKDHVNIFLTIDCTFKRSRDEEIRRSLVHSQPGTAEHLSWASCCYQTVYFGTAVRRGR